MQHLATMGRADRDLVAQWRAATAQLPGGDYLFRTTEGFNVPTVLAHGTDRHGRDRDLRWVERGYRGPPRAFAEVIYASTADEVEAAFLGRRESSCMLKVPGTPDAHLLVYRRDALRPVHDDQYAFVGAARAALVAVFRLTPAVERRL